MKNLNSNIQVFLNIVWSKFANTKNRANYIKTSRIFQNNSLNEAHTHHFDHFQLCFLCLHHYCYSIALLYWNLWELMLSIWCACFCLSAVDQSRKLSKTSLWTRVHSSKGSLRGYHSEFQITHSLMLSNLRHKCVCVCVSAFLWSPHFKRTPCLMAASKNGPKC